MQNRQYQTQKRLELLQSRLRYLKLYNLYEGKIPERYFKRPEVKYWDGYFKASLALKRLIDESQLDYYVKRITRKSF